MKWLWIKVKFKWVDQCVYFHAPESEVAKYSTRERFAVAYLQWADPVKYYYLIEGGVEVEIDNFTDEIFVVKGA